jgi:hypothetical protein
VQIVCNTVSSRPLLRLSGLLSFSRNIVDYMVDELAVEKGTSCEPMVWSRSMTSLRIGKMTITGFVLSPDLLHPCNIAVEILKMEHSAKDPKPLPKLENSFYDTTPKTDGQRSMSVQHHYELGKLHSNSNDSAQRNTTTSPLLRLPRELRDLIWTYTLSGNIIKAEYRPVDKYPRATPLKHRFGLLRTCRQIYAETSSLPWTLSTFSFHTRRSFEECFCQDEADVLRRNHQIHAIQIGADPLDLYGLAETQDSGYGPDDVEGDDGYDGEVGLTSPLSAKFSTFRKLERLEIMLVAGLVQDEEDEDECMNDGLVFEQEMMEESKLNFTKTMREKNPSVRLTYWEFEDCNALRKYWKTTTCLD